jgi:16S rRNA (cytidine1402-2'-O)-methyltransferase
VIARELTKLHESFWRGTVAAACTHFEQQQPKGEFTLILGGAVSSEPAWSTAQLQAHLSELMRQGLSRSEASRQLADMIQLPRRQLYQLSLQLSDERDAAAPDTP